MSPLGALRRRTEKYKNATLAETHKKALVFSCKANFNTCILQLNLDGAALTQGRASRQKDARTAGGADGQDARTDARTDTGSAPKPLHNTHRKKIRRSGQATPPTPTYICYNCLDLIDRHLWSSLTLTLLGHHSKTPCYMRMCIRIPLVYIICYKSTGLKYNSF